VLGLLEEASEGAYRLTLFRGEKQVQAFEIQTGGKQAAGFSLAQQGELAVVRFWGDGFGVYAGGSPLQEFSGENARSASVVVSQEEVFWCPQVVPRPSRELVRWDKLTELPLCFSAPLAGGQEQPFFALDVKRLHPRYPNPSEFAMGLALRSDGKLWLVGLASGELLLASAGGRVLRRGWVPVGFYSRRHDESPEAAAERQRDRQEMLEQIAAREQARERLQLSGPARPPAPEPVVVFETEYLLWDVGHRRRELVFVGRVSREIGALFSVSDLDTPPRCWVLPFPLSYEGQRRLRSTDGEVWLNEPLGYFLWQDLDELWEAGQRGQEAASGSR